MFSLEKRKIGGRWPSVLVGAFLGLYAVLMVGTLFVPSVSQAVGLCEGSYACYTSAACAKAGGDFAACSSKCDEGGRSGRGYCYARQEPIPLTIRIGATSSVIDLGAYIEAVYRYAVAVAGIFAAVVLMIGGIQWLTAGGDSGRIGSAKTRILDALIGLALTLLAWLILNTINPALVRLQMPRIPMVRQQSFVSCEPFAMEKACGTPFAIKDRPGATEEGPVTERYDLTDDLNDPDVLTECVGGSCSRAGLEDGIYTCQRAGETTAAAPACSGCGSGYSCVSCVQDGQACTGIGSNQSCCGRVCGFPDSSEWFRMENIDRWRASLQGETFANLTGQQGTCTNGIHGSKAAVPSECFGGKLVDVSDYWGAMSSFIIGSPALAAWAGGVCMNGASGAPCNSDEDCVAGGCIEQLGTHVCGQVQIGSVCEDDSGCTGVGVCSNNVCVREAFVDNYCDRTTGDRECAAWHGDQFRCDSVGARYICISGAPGTACTDNRHCRSTDGRTQGYCYDGGVWGGGSWTDDLGVCVTGEDGSGCDDDSDCVGGTCFDYAGAGGVCIGPYDISGSPCIPGSGRNGGCADGLICHEQSKTCIASS